ncbi:CEP1 [Symbiodinium natans]|uniref:CEP1 protein n=1 Tax=Symbiodinium natans TaxID=878477 RepID=A0A812PJU2_9DINO|nr:CEP1 [Symbiodinium natans]
MANSAQGGAAAGNSGPATGNDQAEKALLVGIEAVCNAMSGEVRFTNENEAAFALLRKGCRHCSGTRGGEALRQVPVEKQAIVVAFLTRIAEIRRGASRRVQELGAILANASPSWQELLAGSEALGGPDGLLAEELKALVPATTAGEANLPAPVLEHEARVFLRESKSKRYLSIISSSTDACIIMTELPVSLFVCCVLGKGLSDACSSFSTEVSEETEASSFSSQLSKSRLAELEGENLEFGLAHEGVPSCGRFLGSRRRWTDVELCCSSRSFGRRERWSRGPGASLQHQSSGLWLYVDPRSPNKVTLSSQEHSAWEVLPAT